MGKIVIQFLQGSVFTQTALGGLAIYTAVVNFTSSVCLPKIMKFD